MCPRAPSKDSHWSCHLYQRRWFTSALCWQQCWAACPQAFPKDDSSPRKTTWLVIYLIWLGSCRTACLKQQSPFQLVRRFSSEIWFRTSKPLWIGWGRWVNLLNHIQPHLHLICSSERLLSKTHGREFLKYWSIPPIDPWLPGCPLLVACFVLAKGLIFSSCKTNGSDIYQGYEDVGAGPLRLWHKSVGSDFSIAERGCSQEDCLECSGCCWPSCLKVTGNRTRETW